MCAALVALAACDGPAASDAGPGDGGPPDAGRTYVPEAFEPTEATRAYCQGDDDAIEARITELLAELTPEEKIALLHGSAPALVDRTWQASVNERLGIPGLHMLDGPRGLSRFTGVNGTAFPVAMLRGATWDPALEGRVGAAMARELRSVGADVLLAPTINILRHPRWGRAQETYGEDVHHMGELGVAFIEGAQAEGVIASAKHYAANSIEDTRHHVDVGMDERTLREIYLPHFRRAVVEARVGSVMSAYNRVNGEYCDMSRHLLTDILKEEWQFAGFVESDWVLGTHADVESLRAGLDIEMPAPLEFRGLYRALAAGEIVEAEIDRAVRRVLRAQLCFGLEARERTDDPSGRDTAEHSELALEVARRGIVLLKNERADGAPETDPPVLPLDRAAVSSVVVLGRAADVENIGDEGEQQRLAERRGHGARGPARARRRRSHRHAGHGRPGGAERGDRRGRRGGGGDGFARRGRRRERHRRGDRDSLALPSAEVELVQAVAALNPRVIVVLEGGAAITVSPWVDDVEALLFAFYPGQRGGHAIADVIFGDVNPSGRLPFSVPAREEDLPPFDNTSLAVTYDYWHGYRHLERAGAAPAYAFGFGLSYTSFALSELALESATLAPDGTLTATVDVTNTGAVAGIETVQAYVRVVTSRVERAPKDLRAFAQVELEPGETRTVTLTIAARDLAFWDGDAAAWEVEATDYELLVGHDSADLPLAAAFRVE
ncbi:MAG: glycoside hydrolase family 3 C-terminal domain-containing protein [Sandaracinaceae bacterium]|nr:glycoside hydrolase family 3 C-terminal domain-containing protein [Sandaracinaceae bacterium]